ncbi:hypothetical protein [Streptomyces benahoarensis]|uniref:hypothetical protein n=1 Tax=Streptomyces benahoarensis TaxID=2595054 RepID=UPI00163DA308|nr:hypothetical protein [Streptomyces benahoarensis]
MIDNAQHAAEVRPLVPASGLAVVTSRTRMSGLQMDGAAHVVVDPLDEAADIQLIRGWRIAASESAAAELVRRCGGLPLALRAAGERLAGRPHLQGGDAVRRLGTTGPQGAGPAGSGSRRPPAGRPRNWPTANRCSPARRRRWTGWTLSAAICWP